MVEAAGGGVRKQVLKRVLCCEKQIYEGHSIRPPLAQNLLSNKILWFLRFSKVGELLLLAVHP